MTSLAQTEGVLPAAAPDLAGAGQPATETGAAGPPPHIPLFSCLAISQQEALFASMRVEPVEALRQS